MGTIIEDKGYCYLMIKSIERAHLPNNLWEKIRLKQDYLKALKQIEMRLRFWPKFFIHKNKQRFTKITKYLFQVRKSNFEITQNLIGNFKKHKKQILKKGSKIEMAARIEISIEEDLKYRLC